ncbi:MAG: S8 family peptidase [Candidatus Heimdallarchaeota archaeon]|nr:S8 family peptidase [Candidatus Heimdallarchaeota archaeon]
MDKVNSDVFTVIILTVIILSNPISEKNGLFFDQSNDSNFDNVIIKEHFNRGDLPKERERKNSLPMRAQMLTKITSLNIETSNFSWENVSQALGMSNLHTLGYFGQDIKIGIIDNGIDFLNPLFENVSYIKKSFAKDNAASTKTHGTAVAGIISGIDETFPSSPNVTIYSAEMGSTISDNQIIGNITAAFEWLISEDVDIINTSWGGPSVYWDKVFEELNENNITVIGSAGNEGQNGIPSGPGGNTNGISIGSIDYENNISTFSTIGNALNFDAKPDLVTFGENLITANVGLGTTVVSGTSFSTAVASSAISVLLSALKENNLSYNPGLIKSALINTALDLGFTSEKQGAGLINVSKAFELIRDEEKINNVTSSLSIRSGMDAVEMEKLPSGLFLQLPIDRSRSK